MAYISERLTDMYNYTVFSVNLPWYIIDCLGNFETLEDADKAAEQNIREYADKGTYLHQKICKENLPITYSFEDEEMNEGYMYITLPYIKNGCYVLFCPYDDDEKIYGPFKSIKDANRHVFGKYAKKIFRVTTGVMSESMCYAVERKEGSYHIMVNTED